MPATNIISFAPQLHIGSAVRDIDFYTKAFGAIEARRWINEDGSVHVAELRIGEAIFYLHEEKPEAGAVTPGKYGAITCTVALFVPDVDVMMESAIAAGAIELSAARNYEYGYRQGKIEDPFGHHWLLQSKI